MSLQKHRDLLQLMVNASVVDDGQEDDLEKNSDSKKSR